MLVSHLVDYGVPAVVVESWRRRMGEELLPLQEEAVIKGRLLQGESLLIEAPTSAGKTFCAEIAAAQAIFQRRKVLMLVPLKAIAAERFADFRQKYAALGIRVALATGDYRGDDLRIKRGEFDLAILIYEKLNQLMFENRSVFKSVALVIVDELQMLADRDRGPLLELALTKLLLLPERPQLLALTTSASNSEELAAWLGCSILTGASRPVDLRLGVLSGCSYKSLSFNQKQQSEEQLLQQEPCEPEERLLQVVEAITASEEQILIFVRSKRAAENLAEMLAERREWSAADELIRRLDDQLPSLLRDKLVATCGAGVAFHHADLAPALRQTVEEFFRKGRIKVVFATTTLAFGVNLPADSVIVDAYKFEAGEQQGETSVVPLNWREYEAMSGRAGRFGQGKDFGRSLLLAESDLEAESLWKLYVKGEATPIQSRLESLDLRDILLEFFAANSAVSGESLEVILESTLAAREGVAWSDAQVNSAVESLDSLSLIRSEGDEVAATALGKGCKRQGLSVAGLRLLSHYLDSDAPSDRLSWLVAVASLPEAARMPLYLTYQEERGRIWREALLEHLHNSGVNGKDSAGDWLTARADRDYILSREEQRQLKCGLLLEEWCAGVDTLTLEARYSTHFGAMLQLSEMASWLLNAAAEVARIRNCPDQICRLLSQLAAEVAHGHSYTDSIVARLLPAAEERGSAIALIGAGLERSDDYTGITFEQLSEIVGSTTARRIQQSLKVILQSNDKKESGVSKKNGKEASMPLLRLRGSIQGDRVPIRYKEAEIDLTPKSFSYLFKLSAWRLLRPDGWVSKDEIEPGFNQAKNIYRVKQELKRFATGLEKLIENNKSGCYRINLDPEQIRIDHDSMESFCDMELLNLSRRLQQRLAS